MSSRSPSNQRSAKYKYWNEVSLTNQSFIKGMAAQFRLQMTFPEEFIKNFKGDLSGTCTLQGPTGNEWRVRMTQTKDYTFLSGAGWVNFVKDNGIELFDICSFSYYGPSSFKVLIFKGSGTEREVAYFIDNSSSVSSPKPCLSSMHIHCNNVNYANFYDDLEVSKDELGEDEDDDDYKDECEDDEETGLSHKKRRGLRANSRGAEHTKGLGFGA